MWGLRKKRMIQNLKMDYGGRKMERCKYAEALKEERRKIQAFRRELPLCLELVSQALNACKRELSEATTENVHAQSECSEQTTEECGPVLEEFMPIKQSSSCEDEEEEDDNEPIAVCAENTKKSDWLRSVQLWNPSSDSLPKGDGVLKEETAMDVKTNGSASTVFKPKIPLPKIAGGATGKPEVRKGPENDGGKRKQRRCWSPELHRRFINALHQLGGAHVATPKQIKELMKVDGLTNDEVKSHLQVSHGLLWQSVCV